MPPRTGWHWLLLILAILTFLIMMVLGLFITMTPALTTSQWMGILGVGLALFAGSFIPLP